MTVDTDQVVQREVAQHDGITGTYHHYGHLEWWPPGEWLGPYERPECPVAQLASADEAVGCSLIAERFSDNDGNGAWFCHHHGTFRVFGYPRDEEPQTEQQTLAALERGDRP